MNPRRVSLRDFVPPGRSVRHLRASDLPDDVVNVTRGSRYGNPFPADGPWITWAAVALGYRADKAGRRAAAVALYRAWMTDSATQTPVALIRATMTENTKYGPALWLDGRFVARVGSDIANSRITEDDPEPQWRKDALTFVHAVNDTRLAATQTPVSEDEEDRATLTDAAERYAGRDWTEFPLLDAASPDSLREALAPCFSERTDCIHGVWDAVTGDHYGEHLRAALATQTPVAPDVTDERLGAVLVDSIPAVHRWLTVGWKDTMADEAVVLARTLLARLAATEEAEEAAK